MKILIQLILVMFLCLVVPISDLVAQVDLKSPPNFKAKPALPAAGCIDTGDKPCPRAKPTKSVVPKKPGKKKILILPVGGCIDTGDKPCQKKEKEEEIPKMVVPRGAGISVG